VAGFFNHWYMDGHCHSMPIGVTAMSYKAPRTAIRRVLFEMPGYFVPEVLAAPLGVVSHLHCSDQLNAIHRSPVCNDSPSAESIGRREDSNVS
jgi:hypothetical protein